MVLGKKICGELKSLRRRIAEENGIPLRQEECTYTGECSGTCPHCEAEMRYLENAIADRLSIGKAATIAGLALGLATTVQAQAAIRMQPRKILTQVPLCCSRVSSTSLIKMLTAAL